MYNLCCISNELKTKGIGFQTMTWKRYNELQPDEALLELGRRWFNNVVATKFTIDHCGRNGWGYRVSSGLFPLLTHPDFKYATTQTMGLNRCVSNYFYQPKRLGDTMPKQQTTVDFAEIFKYAETKHGIQWSPCNSLFFCTETIRYNNTTGWCLGECLPDDLLEEMEDADYEMTDEIKAKIMSFTTSDDEVCSLAKTMDTKLIDIASMIIAQFAIENDLDQFLIV
jgi:hypothetical protein